MVPGTKWTHTSPWKPERRVNQPCRPTQRCVLGDWRRERWPLRCRSFILAEPAPSCACGQLVVSLQAQLWADPMEHGPVERDDCEVEHLCCGAGSERVRAFEPYVPWLHGSQSQTHNHQAKRDGRRPVDSSLICWGICGFCGRLGSRHRWRALDTDHVASISYRNCTDGVEEPPPKLEPLNV